MRRRIWLWLASAVVLASQVELTAEEKIVLSPRHVAVTGTTVTRVQPDTVVWHVQVRRTNKELAKARAECDDTVRKVLALRDELKLKNEDVQTGYLSAQKIYDRDQYGNQTSFRHFLIERTITLKQRDTSRFDHVLGKLVDAADVEVSYNLESSAYQEVRAKTRLDAVRAARDKAAAMSELLGAKLGRALRIAEPVESWGQVQGINNAAFSGPRQADADEAPGTFAPGAIEVRVSVEVAFEID